MHMVESSKVGFEPGAWNVLSKGNHMVAVTDKGGELWICEEWGPRLGHRKGEGTVYYPHHLTSCLSIKMTCLEGRRRLVLVGTRLCLFSCLTHCVTKTWFKLFMVVRQVLNNRVNLQ